MAYPAAIEIYRTLYNFFPDHLGYGLSLAEAQLEGGANKECLATIRRIRASSRCSRLIREWIWPSPISGRVYLTTSKSNRLPEQPARMPVRKVQC